MDHLQVMKILMEKVNEYNVTLWVAMIDYEKSFDLIEIWAILNALSNARIENLIKRKRHIANNDITGRNK